MLRFAQGNAGSYCGHYTLSIPMGCARLPVKLGGLGVHDPAHCVYAARLACLTRLTDLASDLYLDASEVSFMQQQALEIFRQDIADPAFELPVDHVELQSKLALYGYKQLAARILQQADSWDSNV